MSVRDINDNDHFLSELSAARGLVVVSFTATWCGPCKRFKPQINQLPKKYPQVMFLNVDIDKCVKTRQSQGIESMPTIVFYKNKREIGRIGGNIGAVEAKIKQNSGHNVQSTSKFSEKCSLRSMSPKPSKRTSQTNSPHRPPEPKDLYTHSRPTARQLISDKIKTCKLASHKSAAPRITVRQLINDKIRACKSGASRSAAPRLTAGQLISNKIKACKLAARNSSAPRLTARQLIDNKIDACKLAVRKSSAPRLTARQLIDNKIDACRLAGRKSAPTKLTARQLISDKIEACENAAQENVAKKATVQQACGTTLNEKFTNKKINSIKPSESIHITVALQADEILMLRF